MGDMMRGERGPTGDHGQAGADGRQGIDGRQGERGPEGHLPNDFYEDPAINHAIAQALGDAKIRHNDKRLLILFVFVIVALTIMGVGLTRANSTVRNTQRNQHNSEQKFEQQIIANCQIVRAGNLKVNHIIEQLTVNAKNTKGLTPEQKMRAQEAYASLRLPVTICPVRR